MPRLAFTQNLQRHVACPETSVVGGTVRQALEAFFSQNERARGYVLDDQGAIRTHITVFVNGEPIRDRASLSDPVGERDEIYVMQALSGG